jgi:hypothetical protein
MIILQLALSLGAGGAERIAVSLCNYLEISEIFIRASAYLKFYF